MSDFGACRAPGPQALCNVGIALEDLCLEKRLKRHWNVTPGWTIWRWVCGIVDLFKFQISCLQVVHLSNPEHPDIILPYLTIFYITLDHVPRCPDFQLKQRMWLNLLNRNCRCSAWTFFTILAASLGALAASLKELPCQLSLSLVAVKAVKAVMFLIPQPQLSIEDLDIRLKPAFNGTQPLYPVSGSQIHANRCIVFTESNDVYVFVKKLPRSNATDSLTLWHCTWPTKQWIQSHTLHSKDVFLYAPCQDVSKYKYIRILNRYYRLDIV